MACFGSDACVTAVFARQVDTTIAALARHMLRAVVHHESRNVDALYALAQMELFAGSLPRAARAFRQLALAHPSSRASNSRVGAPPVWAQQALCSLHATEVKECSGGPPTPTVAAITHAVYQADALKRAGTLPPANVQTALSQWNAGDLLVGAF